jgi:S1-C subfamily serine protease
MQPAPRTVAICLVLLCGIASVVHAQTPAPQMSYYRIFFLKEPLSIRTISGTVSELSPGTGVGVLSINGDTYTVTPDGVNAFIVPRDKLTLPEGEYANKQAVASAINATVAANARLEQQRRQRVTVFREAQKSTRQNSASPSSVPQVPADEIFLLWQQISVPTVSGTQIDLAAGTPVGVLSVTGDTFRVTADGVNVFDVGRATLNQWNDPAAQQAAANTINAAIVARTRAATRFVEEHEKGSQAKLSRTRAPDTPTASGTGFFISSDGYLLTNNHVIDRAERISVKVQDQELPASLVSADLKNDLALLKVIGDFTPIPLGEARDVGLGDAVMTIGFPNIEVQGFSPKLTRGEISSLKGIQDDPRLFQISVPLQPGNSGGPLIDASGNAIGITIAQLDALIALKFSGSLPQSVNYALKVSYARLLVESVPHLSEKLPRPQKNKLESSAITDRAIHGTAFILVWQKATNEKPYRPEEE